MVTQTSAAIHAVDDVPESFSTKAKEISSALDSLLPRKDFRGIVQWLAEGRKQNLLNGKELEILLLEFTKNFESVGNLFTDGIIKVSGDGCPLQPWANTHEPGEELIYARGYWDPRSCSYETKWRNCSTAPLKSTIKIQFWSSQRT